MDAPVLVTKLHPPPVRPNWVVRPRLIELLDEGMRLARPLTLVSAPAGCGKTTLVAHWLGEVDLPAAWISLDEGDNDLRRFFTTLVSGLERIDDGLGCSVRGLLEAPQLPPVELLVTTVLNDVVEGDKAVILAVDDYHVITDVQVHQAVGLLVEQQPSSMHLVIVTRHDPPWPLSRLRGRGQITEIRRRDLAFTVPEAAAFLGQTMGLKLAPDGVAILVERTEGWVAGLQLAGLSLRDRDAGDVARTVARFSGRHHLILDYLADEVLRQQPGPIQAFLLHTAILERMCGPLCEALLPEDEMGGLSGQQVLEDLDRQNLFVVGLDNERRWYRYHRLFGDLLQARLEQRHAEQVPELHRRAAAWFEAQGLAAEAVRHALATGDPDLAGDVIERVIQQASSWSALYVADILAWRQALPGEVVRARPWLWLMVSRALFVSGQREEAERELAALDAWLEGRADEPGLAWIVEAVIADRGSYAAVQGQVSRAIHYARRGMESLGPDCGLARLRPLAVLGLAHLRAGAVDEAARFFSQAIDAARAEGAAFTAVPLVCNLAEIQMIKGQLGQAALTCEEAREMGTVDGKPISAAGFVGLMAGRILYERNELQMARRQVVEGLDLLRLGGHSDGFGLGHAILARIEQALGNEVSGRRAMERAVQIASAAGLLRQTQLILAYQARLWLAQGQLDRARRWAETYQGSGEVEYLREFEDLALARILLATGRPADASGLLEALLSSAETAGRWGSVIETLALQALCLDVLGGGSDQPVETLIRALKLGERELYVRVFVDEGPPMADLLVRVGRRGVAVGVVRKLLAVLEGRAARMDDGAVVSERGSWPLAEPLTDREMDVLALLAEGLTNLEIADRLFISLSTVKSHTSHIYGKLGVHGRREAVARAREWTILP